MDDAENCNGRFQRILRSRRSDLGRIAMPFVTVLAITVILASIDTSVADKNDLKRVDGRQPGFARTLGGGVGKGVEFSTAEGKTCQLTLPSNVLRSKVVSGSEISVWCDFRANPARAYEVIVDNKIIVPYESERRLRRWERNVQIALIPALVLWLLVMLGRITLALRNRGSRR